MQSIAPSVPWRSISLALRLELLSRGYFWKTVDLFWECRGALEHYPRSCEHYPRCLRATRRTQHLIGALEGTAFLGIRHLLYFLLAISVHMLRDTLGEVRTNNKEWIMKSTFYLTYAYISICNVLYCIADSLLAVMYLFFLSYSQTFSF